MPITKERVRQADRELADILARCAAGEAGARDELHARAGDELRALLEKRLGDPAKAAAALDAMLNDLAASAAAFDPARQPAEDWVFARARFLANALAAGAPMAPRPSARPRVTPLSPSSERPTVTSERPAASRPATEASAVESLRSGSSVAPVAPPSVAPREPPPEPKPAPAPEATAAFPSEPAERRERPSATGPLAIVPPPSRPRISIGQPAATPERATPLRPRPTAPQPSASPAAPAAGSAWMPHGAPAPRARPSATALGTGIAAGSAASAPARPAAAHGAEPVSTRQPVQPAPATDPGPEPEEAVPFALIDEPELVMPAGEDPADVEPRAAADERVLPQGLPDDETAPGPDRPRPRGAARQPERSPPERALRRMRSPRVEPTAWKEPAAPVQRPEPAPHDDERPQRRRTAWVAALGVLAVVGSVGGFLAAGALQSLFNPAEAPRAERSEPARTPPVATVERTNPQPPVARAPASPPAAAVPPVGPGAGARPADRPAAPVLPPVTAQGPAQPPSPTPEPRRRGELPLALSAPEPGPQAAPTPPRLPPEPIPQVAPSPVRPTPPPPPQVAAVPPRLPPEPAAGRPVPAQPAPATPEIVALARVVVHYSNGEPRSMALASNLAERLRRQGFEVTMRTVPFNIASSGVRYFHDADRDDAWYLLREVGPLLAGDPRAPRSPTDLTRFQPSPKPGTIEIWLATP